MSLYIQTVSGTILNPSEEIPVRIDLQTLDNAEVGRINGDLSQAFEFPATEAHNRFFVNAFTVGGQIVPGTAEAIEVSINNAQQTLFNGTMTLDEWDPIAGIYTCSVESGIVPLADALEGLLLADADWTGMDDIVYSMDTWLAQNSMQTLPDYYFPFMDLGFDPEGRPKVPNDVVLARNPDVFQAEVLTGASADAFGNSRYDADYYDQLYNTQGISVNNNNVEPLTGTRTVNGPSNYFGDVAFGAEVQGTIAHPATPLRIDQFVPAVRLMVVLDKIFAQAGVTYEFVGGSMLDDLYTCPILKEGLSVVMNGPADPENGFRQRANTNGAPIVNMNLRGRAPSSGDNTSTDVVVWGFGFPSQQGITIGTPQRTYPVDAPAYLNNGVFTAPQAGTYEFQFKGSIDNVQSNFGGRIEFARLAAVLRRNGTNVGFNYYKDGGIIASHSFPDIDRDTTLEENRPFDITVTINLQVGDVISAAIENHRLRGDNSLGGDLVDCTFDTLRTPFEADGTRFSIGDQFDDMESLDFLNGVISKLNLVPAPDKDRRNHYVIYQYNDWIRNSSRKDWSNKVVRGTESFESLYAQQKSEVIFADAESDDRFNALIVDQTDEVYGTHTFRDDGDITTGDRTVGDYFNPIIVANPRRAGDIFNVANVNPIHGIPHIYELDGEDATSIAAGIYLGYSKRIQVGEFYYATDSFTSIGFNNYVRTLSNINDMLEADINFSNSPNFSVDSTEDAYTKYWSQYIDHLYNPANRQLTCELFFTPEEYKDTNLNDIIHIDGNDYLIKSISGFNLSEPDTVQAELITYQNNFETVLTPPTNLFVEEDQRTNTFFIGINVNATNDVAGDGVQVPISGALLQNMYYNTFQLAPAQSADGESFDAETESFEVVIAPATRFDVSASNFIGGDNSADLVGVEVTYDDNDLGQVVATVVLTAQDNHAYRNLVITGEVDPTATDSVAVTLNIAEQTENSISNGAVSTPQLIQSGRPGDTITFTSFYFPVMDVDSNNYELIAEGTGGFGDNSGSIAGLSSDYNDFSTGVIGIHTYVIPLTATADFAIATLNVTGGSSVLPGAVTPVSLQINFSEASQYSNASLLFTSFSIPGIAGDQVNLQLPIQPAFGNRLTEGAWSSSIVTGTLGARISAGNSSQNDTGVLMNFVVTLPSSGTEQSLSVPITGQNGIGIDDPNFSTVVITYTPTGSNFTSSEPSNSESLDVVADGTQLHKYTVSPSEGYEFTNTNQVNVTATDGITGLTKTLVGNAVELKYTVSAADTTASINYTGTPVNEPYTLTVNVVNNIDSVMISQGTFEFGFNPTQLGAAIGSTATFTAVSNDSTMAFTGQGDIAGAVASGITLETTAFSGGVISCEIDGVFPMVAEDTTVSINMDGGTTIDGTPNLGVATTLTVDVPHTGIPATGGAILIHVTSDGAWETGGTTGQTANGGRYGPVIGFGNGVITFEAPYLSNTTNSASFGIVVRSTDGTNVNNITLTQNDSFGRRIVFVSTAEFALFTPSSPAQPGILYITPTI